jgi:pimeloyl-ACP methyl ester carboxylesterase
VVARLLGGLGLLAALLSLSMLAGPARSAALPGVGRDAGYRSVACPNPLLPGLSIGLGKGFSCGYETVPENRLRPGGRKIQIAVAIAKARTAHPKADPLLWLEGGPGGTGLAAANSVVARGINADRDVIFVDQRGTLKARPLLSCPGYDEFLVKAFSLAPSSRGAPGRDGGALGACYRGWVAKGYDPSSFNTQENAADMADLRIALHIKRWNVYGVSYGSDLALQLLRDYPDGIRSEVLDSVVPPQVNAVAGFWQTAADGFHAVFDSCAAQSACHAAYPHLWRDLLTAVKRLTRKPLTVHVVNPATGKSAKVVFDGYQFVNLLVVLSLTPGSIVQMPGLVHEMASRDGSQSAVRLLATAPPAGLTGYGLAFGVFCSEDAAFTSPARTLAIARRALPGFPLQVLRLTPQIPHVFADCRAWKVKPASRAVMQPARSDVPVLEMSGTFDAITSLRWARIVASQLPHARIVRFPGVGHGVITWTQCGADVMVGFLDRPSGGYTTRCAARLPKAELTVEKVSTWDGPRRRSG